MAPRRSDNVIPSTTLTSSDQETLNSALGLQQQAQFDDAIALCKDVEKRAPDNLQLQKLLGTLHLQAQHHGQALPYLEAVFSRESASVGDYFNLGLAYYQQDRYSEAADQFRNAIENAPQHPNAHYLLARSYEKCGQLDDATASYKSDLALQVREDSMNGLSNICVQQRRWQEAIHSGAQTLEKFPQSEIAYNDIATALLGQNLKSEGINLQEIEQVLTISRQMQAINPNGWKAHWIAGEALAAIREDDLAITHFRLVLEKTDYEPAKFNLGVLLMRKGQLSEGWPYFASRGDVANGLFAVDKQTMNDCHKPLWQGQIFRGMQLLVTAEQGVGDQILFGQLILELIDQGVEVYFTCAEKILPLMQRSLPTAHIFAKENRVPNEVLTCVDYKATFYDLGVHMRPTMESFSVPKAYLKADPTLVDQFKEKYAPYKDMIKVGIAWSSHSASSSHYKTTRIEDWQPILEVPGVQFFNIQYGDSKTELDVAQPLSARPIYSDPDFDTYTDIEEATAQLATMDLIISVSNASVHMAASMHKPVWVLLSFHPLWHWFDHGNTSPWYDSVTLFRQEKLGSMQDAIEIIASKLRELIDS